MTKHDPTARKVPTGRIARLHRLGSLTTGIAGRMAVDGLRSLSRGEAPQLRQLLLTPANARHLADDLARMRGAAMKLGQLLSMEAGDVMPAELAAILARLRAAADPMPPRQLKQVLTREWGRDWLRAFGHFDVRPIAAASIGQVHRARLKDGREIAVKIQYPGIAASIDSDVTNLGALLRVSGLLPKQFDLAPYLDAVRAQLHEEADYHHEAQAMTAYSALLDGSADFLLPEVIPQWSTKHVLSMSYLPSQPIEALDDAPQELRDRAVERLLRLFLDEVFAFGTVQTDPNFANYRYCPQTDRIVLLDFGAVRTFDAALIARLRDLLATGLAGDIEALNAQLERLGVLEQSAPARLNGTILQMTMMVFDALRQTPFDFARTDLLERLRDTGQQLARDRVPPPAVPVELLYLQRKAAGLFLLATRLRARVDVERMLVNRMDQP